MREVVLFTRALHVDRKFWIYRDSEKKDKFRFSARCKDEYGDRMEESLTYLDAFAFVESRYISREDILEKNLISKIKEPKNQKIVFYAKSLKNESKKFLIKKKVNAFEAIILGKEVKCFPLFEEAFDFLMQNGLEENFKS